MSWLPHAVARRTRISFTARGSPARWRRRLSPGAQPRLPTTYDSLLPSQSQGGFRPLSNARRGFETQFQLSLGECADSGYTLARMRFEVILAPGAAAAYRKLRTSVRAEVRDAIEVHLRHQPTKTSRSRIKRLRGMSQPQYRLRVGDLRVFYDVGPGEVQVLAIVTKAQAQAWLDREGIADEDSGTGKD